MHKISNNCSSKNHVLYPVSQTVLPFDVDQAPTSRDYIQDMATCAPAGQNTMASNEVNEPEASGGLGITNLSGLERFSHEIPPSILCNKLFLGCCPTTDLKDGHASGVPHSGHGGDFFVIHKNLRCMSND
jgi:hypothetical protein